MATPPSFTAGSVLTAAQMNAVGLWRVTTCTVTSAGGTAATASNGVITVGSGNTSVTVANAFSSDFDNYLVTYAGGSMSVDTAIGMQVGTATTAYYGVFNYTTWGSGTANAVTDNNNSKWTYAGGRGQFAVTLLSPNLAKQTVIYSNSTYSNTAGTFTGVETSTTQHTQFVVVPVSGTLTGGTIRVYGYRN